MRKYIRYLFSSLCLTLVFLIGSCGSIKYAANQGFSGYYSYINPRNYFPFSKDVVSGKRFTKLWTIPSGSEACGNYVISDLGNDRALVETKSGYSIYIKNANSTEPVAMKIKQDFSNVIVTSKGLVDFNNGGIQRYDWETGQLIDKITFPIKKLDKETSQNSSWLGNSVVGSNNISYIKRVGDVWLYAVINYQLTVYKGLYGSTTTAVTLNTAQVAVFDPETYSLTTSSVVAFPEIGKERFYYSLEYADAIKDNGYVILGFGDGKSNHWYACVTLDGSKQAKTENGNADFIASKFPDIYTSGKVETDARQASASAFSASESNKDKATIKFGTTNIKTVTWYTFLNDGILAIATPDKKEGKSALYMLTIDMGTIIWQKPLDPDLKISNVGYQDGDNGCVLIPEIDRKNESGLYQSFSLVDGSSRDFMVPANLYILNDGVYAVDGGIINNGTCSALYDERTHEIVCYQVK